MFELLAETIYQCGPMVFGALLLGGAGYGMYMSYQATKQQGENAEAIARYQQRQLEQEAEAARQAGQYESREKRKEGQRLIAEQVAQMGAQGGQITGSNLAILAETAKEIEIDALMIQRNYDIRARQLEEEGQIALLQGKVAKRAARTRAYADLGMNIGSLYFMTNPITSSSLALAGNQSLIKSYGGLSNVASSSYLSNWMSR